MPVDPKPEPVVTGTARSLCGLDWRAHGDDPTVLDCIRLLRADTVRQVQEAMLTRPMTLPQVPPSSWQSPFWHCAPRAFGGTTCSTYSSADAGAMLLNASNVKECSSLSANPASPFGI